MKTKVLYALCIAALISVCACSKNEPPAPGESELLIQVSNYPAFQDSKTIGVSDPGKTEWKSSDVIYLILQTQENPMASRYRITRSSESWNKFEKFENGSYSTVGKITVSSACRAKAYYAPAYVFAESDILELKEGCPAGLDEFLQWKSGDAYDITSDGASITVNFVKDYSRIRVAGEKEYTISLESSTFTPAGYRTSALDKRVITCATDANGNAFFFGTWPDNTTLQFKSYDKSGTYSTSETIPDRSASENGISYAVSCKDSDFTPIATLSAKASTTEASFSAKFKNVVVSYCIGQYAHLEDESGALMIYVSNHGLTAGQRIDGEVSGKIKIYNGVPEITQLNCSKATISSDGIIPETVMTISELLADYDANLSRRILIKGVTVTKGISSGTTANRTGTLTQSGNSLQMYGWYTTSPAVIETGLKGDIIVFPSYYKTTRQAAVYSSDQFTESGSGEDTPFTRLGLMGCYSSTDSDNPVAIMTYEEGADQFSCSKSSSDRTWHLFNVEKGTYVKIDINDNELYAGKVVTADVVINGGAKESRSVTVAKTAGTNAWLEDKTNHVGYVISIQK